MNLKIWIFKIDNLSRLKPISPENMKIENRQSESLSRLKPMWPTRMNLKIETGNIKSWNLIYQISMSSQYNNIIQSLSNQMQRWPVRDNNMVQVGVLPIDKECVRSPDSREKLIKVIIKMMVMVMMFMVMVVMVMVIQTCQLRVSSVMCLLLKISLESVQYWWSQIISNTGDNKSNYLKSCQNYSWQKRESKESQILWQNFSQFYSGCGHLAQVAVKGEQLLTLVHGTHRPFTIMPFYKYLGGGGGVILSKLVCYFDKFSLNIRNFDKEDDHLMAKLTSTSVGGPS